MFYFYILHMEEMLIVIFSTLYFFSVIRSMIFFSYGNTIWFRAAQRHIAYWQLLVAAQRVLVEVYGFFLFRGKAARERMPRANHQRGSLTSAAMPIKKVPFLVGKHRHGATDSQKPTHITRSQSRRDRRRRRRATALQGSLTVPPRSQ